MFNASARYGFSATDASCLSGGFVYAHEIGHNQGAGHGYSDGGGYSSYSNGYRNFSGGFRTIMAYPTSTSTVRIRRFSSATRTYGSYPTGSPTQDNARTINETAATVAAFAAALPVPTRPLNDSFATRVLLSGSASTVSGTNVNGTKEAAEPAHVSAGGASVWWRFTALINGPVTVSTAGSSFDTLLSVYTGSSFAALSLVGSNDDYDGSTSQVTFNTVAGTMYQIAVDGYRREMGSISLTVSPRPLNDAFAARVALPGSGASVSGSNINGSKEPGEPAHSSNGGSSVWWQFTPSTSGPATVSTAGSSFDTLLGVYTGSSVAGLSLVGSNDDYSGLGSRSQSTSPRWRGLRIRSPSMAMRGSGDSSRLPCGQRRPTTPSPARLPLSAAGSTVSGANFNATAEAGEPTHVTSGGRSVWWQFTAVQSSQVTVSTAGSSFDTLLGVYTGSSVAGLSLVGSNDDFNGGTSRVQFAAVAGTTYQIAVDGYHGATGVVSLTVYPAGWSYAPLAPGRVLETRVGASPTVDSRSWQVGQLPAGSVTELVVAGRGGVPVDALAVVLNVTVTGASSGGYVSVYPCGTPTPNASNLNYVQGQTIRECSNREGGRQRDGMCVHPFGRSSHYRRQWFLPGKFVVYAVGA